MNKETKNKETKRAPEMPEAVENIEKYWLEYLEKIDPEATAWPFFEFMTTLERSMALRASFQELAYFIKAEDWDTEEAADAIMEILDAADMPVFLQKKG